MQRLDPEDRSRRLVNEAFARRVLVGQHEPCEAGSQAGGQIGSALEGAAQVPNGMLDAASLPRRIQVAEDGGAPECRQVGVPGELGAVVERDGLA